MLKYIESILSPACYVCTPVGIDPPEHQALTGSPVGHQWRVPCRHQLDKEHPAASVAGVRIRAVYEQVREYHHLSYRCFC